MFRESKGADPAGILDAEYAEVPDRAWPVIV